MSSQYGPLAAEIVLVVWGTQANFNGFRILASLLHGIRAVGASQTVALNRGHQLYSAGRPSRWALAHILVWVCFYSPITLSLSTFSWHWVSCNVCWCAVKKLLTHCMWVVRRYLLFMAALWNRAGHIYFHAVVGSFFFSLPNLSHRRLDVCHTSTHGVALVQI